MCSSEWSQLIPLLSQIISQLEKQNHYFQISNSTYIVNYRRPPCFSHYFLMLSLWEWAPPDYYGLLSALWISSYTQDVLCLTQCVAFYNTTNKCVIKNSKGGYKRSEKVLESPSTWSSFLSLFCYFHISWGSAMLN